MRYIIYHISYIIHACVYIYIHIYIYIYIYTFMLCASLQSSGSAQDFHGRISAGPSGQAPLSTATRARSQCRIS